MSVVVNLLRNDYALIATDSRIMLCDTTERKYADEFEKLYASKIGWVSGTGVGELIRGFSDSFINGAIDTFEQQYKKLFLKYKDEELCKTLISFSYIDNSGKICLEYIGKRHGCKKIAGIAAFQPADIAAGEWNELYNACYDKIMSLRDSMPIFIILQNL